MAQALMGIASLIKKSGNAKVGGIELKLLSRPRPNHDLTRTTIIVAQKNAFNANFLASLNGHMVKVIEGTSNSRKVLIKFDIDANVTDQQSEYCYC